MGRIVAFFIGIITGIVLLLGGTVGVGYYLATQPGSMGKIDSLVGDKLPESLQMSDDIKSLSLMDYGKRVFGAVGNIGGVTIGEFEDAVGYSVFSNYVSQFTGVNQGILQDSKFTDLPKTLTDNITVKSISDKFGIEFPDFPLFQKEDFLNSPISTAFTLLDDETMDAFVDVVYDEDATEENPASSKFLQKLGKKTMSELSNDMDGIIDDTYLHEIISDAPEDSLIQKFLHLKVGELGTETDGVIDAMLIKEIIEIDENSPKVLSALKDCSLETQYEEDGVTVKTQGISDALKTKLVGELIESPEGSRIWTYLNDFTLDTLGDGVENMKVSDAIDTEVPDCNILIKRLADTNVKDVGTEITEVLKITTLGEIIEIDEEDPNTEPMLIALKDVFIESNALNTALKQMTVKDVFRHYTSGVLGLVSPDTLLTDVPHEISLQISSTDLYRLSLLGVYNPNFSSSDYATKAFVYNQSPNDIINNYIAIANDPSSAGSLFTPVEVTFSGTVLDQAALDSLVGFVPGCTLLLDSVAEIPDGTVFTKVFNIKIINAGSLTIGENVSVNLGDKKCGYMYIRGIFSHENTVASGEQFEVSNGVFEDCVHIEHMHVA